MLFAKRELVVTVIHRRRQPLTLGNFVRGITGEMMIVSLTCLNQFVLIQW